MPDRDLAKPRTRISRPTAKRTATAIASALWLPLLFTPQVQAQILPDSTLPNNSLVAPQGSRFIIDGGTTAGSNLFHSFEEFGVPTGTEAFFNNAATIDNIITRVTGENLSNIDGLIRANGSANLFLLNPNGIVFGPNARLDIGGSFFGSTAESIIFENGVEFRATNPEAPPLLTVSTPIGLQLGASPGTIENRSIATNEGGDPVVLHDGTIIGGELTFGLNVSPGKTIALIGGNIESNGGFLTAPRGRIELGAGSNTAVGLSETDSIWRASYPVAFDRGNIALSNGSIVSTSGEGGGSIQIFGRDVRIDGPSPSLLLADTLGDFNGEGITIDAANLQIFDGSLVASSSTAGGNGGDINIRVPGSLQIVGIIEEPSVYQAILLEEAERGDSLSLVEERFSAPGIVTGIEFTAEGNPGHLNIEAGQMLVKHGTQIDTRGGRISIQVDGTLELSLADILNAVIGDRIGGNLEITAQQVIGREGSAIITATFPSSTGPAGDIIIQADLIEWNDTPANSFFPGTIEASTVGDSQGGDVLVDTARLVLRNGTTIATTSGFLFGDGTITPAAGKGGNISIRASESVEIIGESPDSVFPSLISTSALTDSDGGNISIETPKLLVSDGGRIASESLGAGQGGQIDLKVSELILADRAKIAADSFGIGNGGNLSLAVDSLRLNEGSQITATAASGMGGSLIVDVAGSVQLRGGSSLLAEAGGTGNGGNIALNAETIALLENSRITANAFEGNGGNIQIATQGIFRSANSRITASSQLGVDGIVEITNPEVDSATGLVELEHNPLDSSNRIVAGCSSSVENSFVIAGRGGLPPNPLRQLISNSPWVDLRDLSAFHSEGTASLPQENPPAKLVEANGWIVRPNGQIDLVAFAGHLQMQQLSFSNCAAR